MPNINVQLKKNVKNDKYSLFPITHADNVLVGNPEQNVTLSDTLKQIEEGEGTGSGSGSPEIPGILSKLNTIEEGAEVNQNSISKFIIGSTTIAATDKTDSVTLTGNNVTLSGNSASKIIQIGITKSNVTDALGYTPYTPSEVDNKLSALETNIDWKEAVETFSDIATTYPNPEDGWTVNVKDNDYTYRYNGNTWVVISANAIPKATDDVDGLLSKEDHIKYEDANAKKHEHPNKAILDAITAVFTTEEKTKLSGIADGANNYTLPTASLSTLGGVKTTSTVTSITGYTPCPIISGVPYYRESSVTVDTELNSTSTNPVQNKIIKSALDSKADSDHNTHSILYLPTSYSNNRAYLVANASSASSITEIITSSNLIPDGSDQSIGSTSNKWTHGYFYNLKIYANISNSVHIYASTFTDSGITKTKLMVGSAICPSDAYNSSIGRSDNPWNNIYAQRIYSSGGTCGFYFSGAIFAHGNVYPMSNNGYSLGNSSNLFSGFYGTSIYTKSFETNGSGIIPPITLTSYTTSEYTTGNRQFVVGAQAYPFYQFYAYHSYRFSDGTWWNGISFTTSMSVPYGSSSTTTSGRGIEIGENGLQLKVSTSVAYFNCSDGMKCSTGWYTTSDEKVKSFTDDIDIDSSSLIKLVDIIKLRSFKYRYNDNSNIIGINAEELESDMASIGIDPVKYGILNIEYNTYIPRGDDNEDDKFYIKFESVSYERLSILSILKLQDMEEKYSTRLNEVENRLLLLEQKG